MNIKDTNCAIVSVVNLAFAIEMKWWIDATSTYQYQSLCTNHFNYDDFAMQKMTSKSLPEKQIWKIKKK